MVLKGIKFLYEEDHESNMQSKACTVKQCVVLNIFSISLKGKFTVQWILYLMLNLGVCQSSNSYFTFIVYSFERYIWTPLLNNIKKSKIIHLMS